jgi:hypothetical protein
LLHQRCQLRFGYLGQFRLWARHGLEYTGSPIRYARFSPGLKVIFDKAYPIRLAG